MREHIEALVDSAAEVFELKPPIYEFGFHSTNAPGATALVGGAADGSAPTTRIDRLEDLSRLPFPDHAARTVICTETLEYVFEPHRAVEELIRILAPGGILIVSATGRSPLSERPDHYWHFTPNSVQRLLAGMGATLIGWQGAERSGQMVFGIGCKLPLSRSFVQGTTPFMERFERKLTEVAGRVPWRERLKRLLAAWTQGPVERRYWRDYYKAQFVVHLPLDRQLKHKLLEGCLPAAKSGSRLDVGE